MGTLAYPARGDNGLTEEQWSRMHADRDGIVSDYIGTACALTVNDATNKAKVGAGRVAVNGYVLEIDADGQEVDIPPAVGSPVSYHIAAHYDPTLNVATESGGRSLLGPVRLEVFAGNYPTEADGNAYVVLWLIQRAPSQVLSAATKVDYRRWVGYTVEMTAYQFMGNVPRGSIVLQSNKGAETGNISVRTINAAGTALEWKSLNQSARIALPTSSLLVANLNDTPATIHKEWTRVYIEGTLRRSSGAKLNVPGSAVNLGTLPVGWRPKNQARFTIPGPGWKTANIVISPDTGVITMYDTDPAMGDIAFVQFDGVSFRAEN
jgi:hypothetical protein